MQSRAISLEFYQERKKKKLLTTGSSKAVSRSVQSLSCVQLFVTLWTVACQASLSIDDIDSVLTLDLPASLRAISL